MSYKYREFKCYTDWKDPRINKELPFRQYLPVTYNKDIAKKYNVEPCDEIPTHFARDLSKIRDQLKYDTAWKKVKHK